MVNRRSTEALLPHAAAPKPFRGSIVLLYCRHILLVAIPAILLAGVYFGITVFIAAPTAVPLVPSTPTVLPPCDLYDLPGRLSLDDLTWKPSLVRKPKHCTVDALRTKNHIESIRGTSRSSIPLPRAFKDKLLLVVGDSNDRNVIQSTCELIEGRIGRVHTASGELVSEDEYTVGDAILCIVRPGESPKLEEEAMVRQRQQAEEARLQKALSGVPASTDHPGNAPALGFNHGEGGVPLKPEPEPSVRLPGMGGIVGAATFGRRDEGAVSSGKENGVFVVLFVFHYGLALEDGDTRNHLRPGLSFLFRDIVGQIPNLINILAPIYFPELIPPVKAIPVDAGPNQQPAPPQTVLPTLIVSQSALWEVIAWQNHMVRVAGIPDDDGKFEAGLDYGFPRLESDLRDIYFASFDARFPGVPLAWRTCPETAPHYRFRYIIETYNEAVVDALEGSRVRILDWHKLVKGRDWFIDHIHQTVPGQLSMGQLLLEEMVRMDRVR
ncbi:hypothetical protein HK101_001003 [Irineochytrium annulatum]|nr:hypothetical protein HK101_001003 [Irineochytrium annulatum]